MNEEAIQDLAELEQHLADADMLSWRVPRTELIDAALAKVEDSDRLRLVALKARKLCERFYEALQANKLADATDAIEMMRADTISAVLDVIDEIRYAPPRNVKPRKSD